MRHPIGSLSYIISHCVKISKTTVSRKQNSRFCSRARREEMKKRSVLGVHEHFSPTSNAAIGQKMSFTSDLLWLPFFKGCSKYQMPKICHFHSETLLYTTIFVKRREFSHLALILKRISKRASGTNWQSAWKKKSAQLLIENAILWMM